MITLANRDSVFKNYPKIAAHISEMQQSFFDDDPEYFETEQDRIHYTALFDAKDIFAINNKSHHSVITFEHSDITTYTTILSRKLIDLLSELRIEKLLVLSHLKMSFIGNQNNKYKPLKKAFKSLERITQSKNFQGVLELNKADLPEVVDIFFWITRCDASAPEYIFFCDEQEKLIFNICKYGDIHITEISDEILSDELLSRSGFEFQQGRCYNRFSEGSKIEGEKKQKVTLVCITK